MKKKEPTRKGREKEEKEQHAAPKRAVKVKNPYHNSGTVVQPALPAQQVESNPAAIQEGESTQEQPSKVSPVRKQGIAGGIVIALGGGLGAAQMAEPRPVPPVAGKAQNTHGAAKGLAAHTPKREAPPKIVCKIKITIPAGEENSADLVRLVSTIEKAASEHPEEPPPQISRTPGKVAIWLAGTGAAVSALSAAQPLLVQWAKGSQKSVAAKFKNEDEEEEIVVKGTSDVERVCKALKGLRRQKG